MKFSETVDERYATLSQEQVANALGITMPTLRLLHSRGMGPPRFRAGTTKWAYPLSEFREWQKRRIAEARAEPSSAITLAST